MPGVVGLLPLLLRVVSSFSLKGAVLKNGDGSTVG